MAAIAFNSRLAAGWNTSSAGPYTTGSFTPTQNKLLVLWVWGSGNGVTVPSQPTITDSAGRTWSFAAASPVFFSNRSKWFLFTCVDGNATPAAGTVTVDFGSTTSRAGWAITQYDNALTSNNGLDAVAQAVAANLFTTTSNVVSGTMSQSFRDANSLGVAVFVSEGVNAATITPSNSWSATRMKFGQTGGPTIGYFDGPNNTPGLTFSSTGSETDMWAFELVDTAVSGPANTVVPAITGTYQVGSTLTTDNGSWTGSGTITYAQQWQRSADGSTNWADIAGATGSTYQLTAADDDQFVRSAITATDSNGPNTAYSGVGQMVLAPGEVFVPWSAQHTQKFGSTEVHFFAIPGTDTVLVAYYDGSGNVKVQKSLDGANTFAAAVTVASGLTFGDVMLNEPWAYDAVTGRLHLLYGHNIDQSGQKAVLCHRYTDDLGATWSAEHVIDDATAHTGTDAFYRVGMWARDSIVSIHYAYILEGPFTTDGLWRVVSTDGGDTWPATGTVYTSTVIDAGEPNVWGFTDGTVIVSWYDDGQNNNQSGDLWISRSLDNGQTWDASPRKITTTTDYGRPRIKGENGTWWIVANKPWDKEVSESIYADVYTLTSTDNGITWTGPTLRGTHTGTKSLSHPDIAIQGDFVGVLWNNTNGGHGFVYSIDGGSTFSNLTNPFNDASTSDAPRLLISNSYLVATGYDQAAAQSMWVMNPQWFAVLPQVQTSVLDDFNRAAENPLSDGGKWTTVTGQNALRTNGTAATRQKAAGTFDRSGSYFNAVGPFTGNVETWLTTVTDGGEVDLLLIDAAGQNGYSVGLQDDDFPIIERLERYDAGTNTTLLSDNGNGLVGGDKICLQIVQDEIVAWRWHAGIWSELWRTIDTSHRASLVAMAQIAGTAGTPAIDDFGGGVLNTPANTVAPTISGTIQEGQEITCAAGTWSNQPTHYTYQWQNSPDGSTWTDIPGAALPFYTIAAEDSGKSLRCVVTGLNAIGSAAVNTNSTANVPGEATTEIIGAIPI